MTEQRKLRILEIAISGTIGVSDMGPVSATICALANGFDALGHFVTVCDTTAVGPRCNLNPRIRLVTVPLEKRWPRLFEKLPAKIQEIHGWLSVMIFLWFLYRRVKLSTFDVVHVHDHRFACLFALLAPNRYYYTSHDSVWALRRDQGAKWSARGSWDAFLETFAIGKSRATIALGDYLTRQVPGGRLETIPHGIDPLSWQPLDRDTARAALGISAGVFMVVFVGRIHPQKGVDVLIEAVQRVAPVLPRLRVFVIGSPGGHYDAEERPSPYAMDVMLRAQGAPVQFVGFLRNQSEQLRRYLSACDVAVVPSRHEPFGYVALEALAMSVPVIASRTGGLAQTVTEDVGLLVPPEDIAALAAAIRTTYEEPTRLRRLREKCRTRVVERYSRDESVLRHLALFMRNSDAIEVENPKTQGSSCSAD
jgi:glycosyltransferase involved in cell wall biosynthesis